MKHVNNKRIAYELRSTYKLSSVPRGMIPQTQEEREHRDGEERYRETVNSPSNSRKEAKASPHQSGGVRCHHGPFGS